MAHAFIFPGQGAQFTGMGKTLYDNNAEAKMLFENANEILGFRISDVMFTGTDEELRETSVTQPAIFIHSVAAFKNLENPNPGMTAGHSLGEFSALVAAGALSFEAALRLVQVRANAMQKACGLHPSTMAAVLGLADEMVEDICAEVTNGLGEVVVAANYNCPGQIVISGTLAAVDLACEKMKMAGAKRALKLPVGGAFHSPLMASAREELAAAIETSEIKDPACPVYQNVVARSITDRNEIKSNLIEQLTGPVKWTQCVQSMIADGATLFTECGPGKVLQGLVMKIDKTMQAESFD